MRTSETDTGDRSPESPEQADSGVGEPFAFGWPTLRKGDPAVYCPGHGFAYRAVCTGLDEGRIYHHSVFPDGSDIGSGSWHSELHTEAEFLERGTAGALGPVVAAAIAQGGDLDAIIARLEPANRRGDQ